MPMTCPNHDDLVRYAQALLSAEESRRIGEHLDACEQCEASVARLEREQHPLFGLAARIKPIIRDAQKPIHAKLPRPNSAQRELRALKPNTEIGDCRLLHELGSGGFARVFLARQAAMQRSVALKISTRPSNEPKLLGSLDHPHIVRVYHYDDRTLADRGLYLLYMPHVSGCSLQEVIKRLSSVALRERSGKMLLQAIQASMEESKYADTFQSLDASPLHGMDWATAVCWIGARLADAVAYAHGRNILHRDIKPANILMMSDGNPLLLDFNVGFGADVDGSTVEEDFGGSLPYMSPEQLAAYNHQGTAESVGKSSDTYSLAVVLFELFTGNRPRTTETVRPATTIVEAGLVPVDSPSYEPRLPSDCPRGLAETLQRCLSSSPSERYGGAASVARELQLVTDREVHDLLRPDPRSLRALVARHPMLTLAACSVVPNGIFAFFNIRFVEDYWTTDFHRPDMFPLPVGGVIDYYEFQQLIVNAIVFPGGLSVLLCFSRPMCRALDSMRDGARLSHDEREHGIECCLQTGVFAWRLVLGLWIATGIVYPGWNWLAYQLAEPNCLNVNVHPLGFLSTQIFHGALAASITFLCITFASVQSFLPRLLKDAPALVPARLLDGLLKRVNLSVIWLTWAPTPAFLSFIPLFSKNQDAWIPTITVMCIVFACSLGLGKILETRIHRHASNLKKVLAPTAELLYGRSS